MSYAEIARWTGELQREGTFILPRGADAILRQLPNYADYSEERYCLRRLKPGTGTVVDAPKGMWLMLKDKLENDCPAWVALSVDPDMYMRFLSGVLVGLIATHADDLKRGGLKLVLDELIQRLEKTFGPLAKQEKELVNTGFAHRQTDEGRHIYEAG